MLYHMSSKMYKPDRDGVNGSNKINYTVESYDYYICYSNNVLNCMFPYLNDDNCCC